MNRFSTLHVTTLICAALFLAFPLILVLVATLTPPAELFDSVSRLIPSKISLVNITSAIQRGHLLTCLKNSFVLAFLSASAGIVIGFPAAYMLARYKLPHKALILSLLLLLRLLPKMPAMAAYYHLASITGLLDHLGAVVLVRGGGVLLALWLMKAAIESVPLSLERSALLDGFSRLQVVAQVTIRLSLPGIATAFLLEFASAWNSFLLPLLFLGRAENMTVSLGIDRFLSENALEPGPLLAFALLVSLPLLILFPKMLSMTLSPYRHRLSRRSTWK